MTRCRAWPCASRRPSRLGCQPAACSRRAAAAGSCCSGGQGSVVPHAQRGRQQLGGGQGLVAHQRVGNAAPVNRQAQCLAHAHIAQRRQPCVELDDDRARQRDGRNRHLAAAPQPPQAGRVQPVGQIGLTALGHQRTRLGTADREVAHRCNGRARAVVAVKRHRLDLLRRHHHRNAVGAAADDALHLAVCRVAGRGQHHGAGVRQQCRQRRVRALQADRHRALVGRGNRLDGRLAQQRRRHLRRLQAAHHGACRDPRAIVKTRGGPQQKVPLQAVGRHAPALGQCRLGLAVVTGAHQGFGDLEAREHITAAGRGQATDLPRADDLKGRWRWHCRLRHTLRCGMHASGTCQSGDRPPQHIAPPWRSNESRERFHMGFL